MKRIYKDSEDNIRVVSIKTSFTPPEDWTFVGDVENEDIPTNKYKNCWVDNGSGGIKIDLPKARVQKENEIRTERDRILKLTDNAFLIALSKAEATTNIEADKVLLRDMMADVTTDLSSKIAATTIDAYDGFAAVTLAGTYE